MCSIISIYTKNLKTSKCRILKIIDRIKKRKNMTTLSFNILINERKKIKFLFFVANPVTNVCAHLSYEYKLGSE